MNQELCVFLVAGEPSGDLLGARLMEALKDLTGGKVRFVGIGGERMTAEGLSSLFPLADLTLMGVAEVLPRLPLLLRRLQQTVAAAQQLRPDVVVTIDAPDFSFRVGRRLKALAPAIPLVHYVAPSVWAWRPGRARKIASFLDHLLALLPFEPPYFERVGLGCTFVGHPILESAIAAGSPERFRAKYQVPPESRIIAVLPGSRHTETSRLLPDFAGALAALGSRYPGLVAAVPTVPHRAAAVTDAVAGWPVRAIPVLGDSDKYDAFAAAEVALAASGTVALELGLARVPMVIAYRAHPVTAVVVRRLIRAKYACLINILLDRPLVPELLQEKCRPDRLAEAVATLLDDPAARRAQVEGAAEASRCLGEGGSPPSRRAAEAVLGVVARAKEARAKEARAKEACAKEGGR